MPLKRTHADGIECSIHEESSTRRTISVTYRQRHASFLASREMTLEEVTCSPKTDPRGMLEFLHFRKEFEHEEEPIQ